MYVLYGTANYLRWRNRHRKRLILFSFACLILITAGLVIMFNYPFQQSGQLIPRVSAKALASTSQAAHATSPNTAVSSRLLIIPKLNSEIPVESVGLTKTGAMDIPVHTSSAGWYKLGPLPGQSGSAVIDGHNNVSSEGLGVFGRIGELISGDKIIFQDKGKQKKFTVVKKAQYAVNQVPLQDIFGATGGFRLNLITCAGKWNRTTQSYPERLVVYSTLDISQ